MYSDSKSDSDATVTSRQLQNSKRAVICSYPTCNKRFKSEKDMKVHKKEDPDHHYCKKCDLDFDDWDALTQHKADEMRPWLDSKRKVERDRTPKHIVCEFCGMDFKSFGGRRLHREQNHRADQSIECRGCKAVFTRPGHLISHYENDQCPEISKWEFKSNVQQKQIMSEVMENPGAFQNNLDLLRFTKELKDSGEAAASEFDEQSLEGGGVAIQSILDSQDAGQRIEFQPLRAEFDLIDVHDRPKLFKKATEGWPRLPTSKESDISDSMRRMSLGSTASEDESEGPANEFASQVTSRRGGVKVYTESFPSLNSPSNGASIDGDSVASNAASMTSQASSTAAWTTGNTAKALFKNARATPKAGDWDAIAGRREEESLESGSTNLLHSRFWDPASSDYDSSRFFNHMINKYCCPFDNCDLAVYRSLVDLERHIAYTHVKREYICPRCYKRFKTGAQLIDHSESGGRCKVKKSTKYDKLLDEVSGGYLKVEHLRQPKIYRQDKAGEKDCIMDTKYTGKFPGDR